MISLYLDESGDHSLDKVDPTYPVFVLGGIIIDEAADGAILRQQVSDLKVSLFGRDDLILRTADIRRNRNGFESLKDPAIREEFYRRVNELMTSVPFSIVACAINKRTHMERYGDAAIDPYMLSLNVLVERFYFELSRRKQIGMIIAERRDPVLDRQLDISWTSLIVSGTQFVQGSRIRDTIKGMRLSHKHENLAGLQLADLVVSPIGRYVLGKRTHEDWRIVESKFRRHKGKWEGAGLVVLPK
jgi:hypothetical protein